MSNYSRPTGFGSFSFFPPIIKKLLIINVAVFLIQMLSSFIKVDGLSGSNWLSYWFGLNPLGGNFMPWQLISYQFMHSVSGISHILFNMFILWMFGMEIENFWGSKKFLFFYLLCGVFAGIAQLLFASGITIGASGAVFGVMVAFALMFPDRYIYLYFLIPVKAKYLIAFLVAIEFLSIGEVSIIARIAHVGGALTGLVFVLLDKKYHFNIGGMFNSMKNSNFSKETKSTFRAANPFKSKEPPVQDAEYYDINGNKSEDKIDQDEIDKILDKISQSGYQNLSEREKKVLFEASKKN